MSGIQHRGHRQRHLPRAVVAAQSRALDTAKAARLSGFTKDFEGIGRPALHMDVTDLYALYERFPELDPIQNPDAMYRAKCWKRWMASSASQPYRVRDRI